MTQRQGEASENVKVFQTLLMRICSDSAAAHERWKAAVGNVLGSIMKTTMAANQRSGQRDQQFLGRYTVRRF